MFVKKKLALAILLAFSVILGAAAAVAAFTSPLEFAPRKAVLTADAGTVEVRRGASDAWIAVSGAVELFEGDGVRTGPNSAATIDYFEQGQARLDADTAIRLEKLRWDPERPTAFVGEVYLEGGRLWSRLLDFLTPESAYVAKTANTVATVRGTAFALSSIPKDYEGVFVAEHEVRVDVRQDGGVKGGAEVARGMTARIDRNSKSAKPITMKVAGWDAQEAAWIDANIPKDHSYDAGLAKRRLDEAKRLMKIRPDSALARLVDAAEGVRLAVTFDVAVEAELQQRFLARRLLTAYVSAEEGRTEEAKAIMTAIEPAGIETAAGADVGMAVTFLAQKTTTLRADMIEAIKQAAPSAAGMIERVRERRLKFELLEPMNSEPVSAPVKDDAVAQPTADQPAPTDSVAVPIIDAGPTGPKETTVTEPKLELPPIVEPVAAKPVSLKVSADKQNLAPLGRTALQALAVMSDGSSKDVTSLTRWSAGADADTGAGVGTIDGNVFSANADGGKTSVTGVFAGEAGTFSGSVEITVLLLEF